MTARRLAFLSLFASVAAFAATVALRDHTGTSVVLDAGVYNVPFAVSIAVLLARARADPEQGASFRLLALGLGLFTAGNLVSTIVWNDDANPPYPSIADALWLSWYALAFAAIHKLVRVRVRRVQTALVLDSAIVGLTTSALASAFIFRDVLGQADGDFAQVATNLAYPIADLMLLALLAGTVLLTGLRVDRGMATMCGGIVLFVVADSIFLLEDAGGGYVEGGPLDILWPSAVALIAASSLLPVTRPKTVPPDRPRWLAIPVPAGLGAWAIIVANAFVELPWPAVVFAAFALLAVLARALVAVRERGELSRVSELAITDDLTLLHNRRGFWDYLRSLPEHAPCGLVMLDFDHFKAVNDRHGHAVGDDVLREAARRVVAAVGRRGLVSRVGGEEFAVVCPRITDEQSLRSLAEQLRLLFAEAPIATARVQLGVTASLGCAIGPPGDPLIAAADRALYAAKRRGRNQSVLGDEFDTDRPDVAWADLNSLAASLGVHLYAGTVRCDGSFDTTFVSEAFCKRLQIETWGEMPETQWVAHIVPADRERYARELSWDVLSRHGSVRCCYRMAALDGTVIDVAEDVVVRSRDADGSIRIEGSVTDMTARRRAEKRLVEVGTSLGLHLYVGVARQYLPWSDNLGPETNQLLMGGSPPGHAEDYEAWRSRVHPDDIDEYDRMFTFARCESEQSLGLEYRMIGYDGVIRSVRETILPRERLDLTSIRFEGVIQDVTNTHGALIDLQLLGRIDRGIPILLYEGVQDADGSYRSTSLDGSFDEITGSRPLLGEHPDARWVRHVHADDRERYAAWSRGAHEQAASLAYRVVQASGGERTVIESRWMRPVRTDGSRNVAGLVIDLTGELDQLRALDRAAASDARAA